MGYKKYYTPRPLSKLPECPLSEFMIRKLVSEGKIPHIKVSDRKYLIEYATFVKWLESAPIK